MEIRILRGATLSGVMKLRRAAYDDLLSHDHDESVLSDVFDLSPTTWHFGCFDEDALVASMRISLPPLPCRPFFPQVKELTGNVVEVSRTCIDPNIISPTRRFNILRALVRDAIVTCRAINIEHVIAAARPEYAPYYKMIFGFESLGKPAPYPPAAFPIPLLYLPLADALVEKGARYSFVSRITPEEIATRRHKLLSQSRAA